MMLAQRIDALHEEQMGHAKNEMTGGTKKEFLVAAQKSVGRVSDHKTK